MYKNYLLDLYNTIIHVEKEESEEIIWDKMAMLFGYYGAYYDAYSLEKRFKKLVTKMLHIEKNSDNADYNIEDVFYKLLKEKKIKPRKNVVRDIAKSYRILSVKEITCYEGVIDLLEKLESLEKNIYLITNGQQLYGQAEIEMFKIGHYFKAVYFSSEYRRKGSLLHELAIEDLALKKKNTVIISKKQELALSKKCSVDQIVFEKNIGEIIKGIV